MELYSKEKWKCLEIKRKTLAILQKIKYNITYVI